MKKSIVVTSVLSKLSLPKSRLEYDVNKRNKNVKLRFVDIALPGFESLTWRFIPTIVSGDVEIVFTNKKNDEATFHDVPVTTSFLAACTKKDYRGYKLTFAISLS